MGGKWWVLDAVVAPLAFYVFEVDSLFVPLDKSLSNNLCASEGTSPSVRNLRLIIVRRNKSPQPTGRNHLVYE